MKKRDITTDPTDIMGKLGEYYKQLYVNKFSNFDDMD